MRRKRIEVSIRIQAPIELVWAITQDAARRPAWDGRVAHSELLTPLPMGKGARVRHHYSLFGLRSWIDLEYITWEPLRRASVRLADTGPGSLVRRLGGSWQYEGHPDGSTTWTTRFNVAARGGRLAPLLTWVLLHLVAQRATEQSARRLKQLAEAEYATAHGAPDRLVAVARPNRLTAPEPTPQA